MSWQILYRGSLINFHIGDAILVRDEFNWRKPITWLSFFVRFFTGCIVNHTRCVSVDADGNPIIVEAKSKIVASSLFDNLDRPGSKIIVRRSKKSFDVDGYVTYMNQMLGSQYDLTSLVWHQLIYRLSIWFGRFMKHITNGHVIIKPIWNGKTGERAAQLVQCAELYATGMKEDQPWLYSTREIHDHPHYETIFFEVYEAK